MTVPVMHCFATTGKTTGDRGSRLKDANSLKSGEILFKAYATVKLQAKQAGMSPNPLSVPSGVVKLYEPECALVRVCMSVTESRRLGMSTFPGYA
ncbi:hypothetical protein CRG98_043640 [Punica granatum]|uniref:Uncharacterized protein n=1 Tax=Punica granatum TaxID=22663 RepID=A0A2I0HW97_PUNGR|nr:hypothetical protein CRG98_043640 [Punica granatum]